jgi:hypothetical protein
MKPIPVKPDWENNISAEDWAIYNPVLKLAEASGVRFAIGGAFALATYTNHLRNTKDLDLYILPDDKERMIEIVEKCGMKDLYSKASYDRNWIYRCCGETQQIIDIIWSMPNRRSVVDEHWVERGPSLDIRGSVVRAIPLEELLWAKMYVVQRERCDWPDILNLLFFSVASIDWDHLLRRIGSDFPILEAILTLFKWLCPEGAEKIPSRVWEIFKTPIQADGYGVRPFLLDTRPWFGVDFQRWPDKK